MFRTLQRGLDRAAPGVFLCPHLSNLWDRGQGTPKGWWGDVSTEGLESLSSPAQMGTLVAGPQAVKLAGSPVFCFCG